MPNLPQHLINGYRRFRNNEYPANKGLYEQLATEGQHPEVMVISCADSRVDPATIFNMGPGDLFVSRNVANLVPPSDRGDEYRGIPAAIEFAVLHLKVKHLMVLGHSSCGGIKALMDKSTAEREDLAHISKWVSLMNETRNQILAQNADESDAVKLEKLECASICQSLDNLRSFSFIAEKEQAGELQLHGAYYDLHSSELSLFDPETGRFSPA